MSLYAEDVRARTLTREQYREQRHLAFRIERDAAFLRGTHYELGERAMAAQLRADLAAPADPVEQARERRLHRLRAALHLAAEATRRMQDARRIARSCRAA